MERKIEVSKNKCIHCGRCVRDCIVSCLKFDGEKIPVYSDGGVSCVMCQHCMAVCPMGALSFGGKNPDESAPFMTVKPDELLNMMKSRRSIRHYKDEDIPPETIQKLTELLAYTPKGGNVDALHFSVVSTRAKMQEVRNLSHDSIMKLETDSPMLNTLKQWVSSGHDMIFRGAPSMIVVSVDRKKAVPGCEDVDPIIALSYFELYANSLGIGTLWDDAAEGVIANCPEVRKFLGIPEGYTPNFALLMGVPAVSYRRAVQKEEAYVTIV